MASTPMLRAGRLREMLAVRGLRCESQAHSFRAIWHALGWVWAVGAATGNVLSTRGVRRDHEARLPGHESKFAYVSIYGVFAGAVFSDLVNRAVGYSFTTRGLLKKAACEARVP